MKRLYRKSVTAVIVLLGVCGIVFPHAAQAAGLLTPKNSNLPELEIRDHKVRVVIEDGYAITTVDQTFFNPHGQDLEAIYSFPVPDRAAVSEFTMWIDGKPIHGEVLEKKKAREVYEDQKKQGNDAGLTEKNDYKVFEISVSPVRAGQETNLRLSYIQPAHVDTSIGRYMYPLQEGGVDDHALAFWMTNEKVTGTFSFDLVLKSSYPVEGVRLPSHPHARIAQNGDEWTVHLDNLMAQASSNVSGEPPALTLNEGVQEAIDEEMETARATDPSFRLDTDIVVYYRHQKNLPGAVDLVTYKREGDERGTFMLTLTPGMDLKTLQGGRDWIFVLDISGSMKGKYATLAEGVRRALGQMPSHDRFRIIVFNNQARELTNGMVVATAENIKRYADIVATTRPDGGTNVYAGMQLGLNSLDADRTSSMMLVTDGVANVGVTEQKSFVDLVKRYDVRLFTFIMGNSANRPLLKTLTRVSNGFSVAVSNSDDIIGKILEAQSKVNFQALHGAKVSIQGVRTSDITPDDIRTVYRGQQMLIFGHYFGGGRAKVNLTGKISGEKKSYATEFDFPETSEENPEIERLWAYATIERLSQDMEDFGEKADVKQSIVDIGVEYGLVTDYTSMIVLEEQVFQELGIDRRNHQRLETEYAARQARTNRGVTQRRVDTNKPMFSGQRPSFDLGVGAFDPLSCAALAPLLWAAGRRKRKGRKEES